MKGELICVGTELLLGDILNTNAQYLSQQFALLGISMYHQSVVGDNENRLFEAVKLADSRSDIIILTGGLGPTSDDITKETVAKFYNKNIVLNEETLKRIEVYFTKRNRQMTENNKKTAYTIEGAKNFLNNNGTAPGILVGVNDKKIILLPGPPNELLPMFKDYVKPYLMEISNNIVVSRTLKLVGIGESEAAFKIQDIIDEGINPTVAPYAKLSEVHLRMTASGEGEAVINKLINQTEERIRERLGEFVFTNEDKNLEDVIVEQLNEKQLKISTAESITGGLIASTIVNVDGASSVFDHGIITYSNEAKVSELNVSEESLKQYGAVSESVAKEMALGVCKKTGSQVGVSITGIAGPTGGTATKPVGLNYIGVAIDDNVFVEKFELVGNRSKIRQVACKKALTMVYQKLQKLG